MLAAPGKYVKLNRKFSHNNEATYYLSGIIIL